ncbi:biotin synthase [Asticcacaulis sp. AC460]|uniref:biotin synthase BioB n=1 Tax=Asticcacaulis sp. AC460 TaxID=1282360 RepID=UPI0003C3DEAF|nr:biotin synthase BioB [Asticcacaulis sp. AC460]ESQ86453.1 biotin synthase [Asticcacaulis sp. AC460]
MRQLWDKDEIAELFDLPFMDLVLRASEVHRYYFPANEIQLSQLLSVKTGGCAENCGYCSQSAHFDTGLKASRLMAVDTVLAEAQKAKDSGAQRFCMGAAWRDLKDRDVPALAAMIGGVKAMGLETCATLGMLRPDQAVALKEAGLDYYNHNLDTSPEYYDQVVTTRTYQERLDTLQAVADAGMKTCCGGIMGMGESRADRVSFLHQLAALPVPPDSIPINNLVAVAGTPLGDKVAREGGISGLEFVRTIAAARIVCPRSMVRLSAGRTEMSEELQALCFLAGANSIFVGDTLLTTPNPQPGTDAHMMRELGLRPMTM